MERRSQVKAVLSDNHCTAAVELISLNNCTKHHIGVLFKVFVDRQSVLSLPNVYPIGNIGHFGNRFAFMFFQEDNIRSDFRACVILKRTILATRQTNSTDEVSLISQHLADTLITLIECACRGHECHDSAVFELVECFGKEEIVQFRGIVDGITETKQFRRHIYVDLTKNLGGCFIDLMSGEYIINVLKPKSWGDERGDPAVDSELRADDENVPKAFRFKTKLSQHISFLRDFFRIYKDFSDREIDTIELLLIKLYEKFGISDDTDWNKMQPTDYPILSDFYELVEAEYKAFNPKEKSLYTVENLQNICLGLHSICKGAESKFFNGYTNITDSRFITFGVKGLLQASKNIRNALLFNVLAYMSEQLLSRGNTVASIDEFYLFLTNLTAVEYIRNFMKRVRKKESAVILASQNIEDFLVENVRELTKPLFSIPTHIFLFYPGTIEKKTYMDTLQVEDSEYGLIQFSQRGVCLYKCGNERYCLCVIAPDHKAEKFGAAGGR